MPPSFEELCRRLAGRGTEDAAAVGRRLSNAAREMEAAKHYDYIVVNQTVEDAVDQLEQIVCAAKHTAKYLREFSGQTQFIVVTHREGTMEECDLLYGATMQQKGVTKLVSVKLKDAIDLAQNAS